MQNCAYDFCRRTRCSTYQHDSESDLDYAMARYYASRSGRFMTPDPGHVGANVGDPQSWNAYVYGRHDPVNLIDPTGTTIIEIIPDKYRKQYDMWKTTFLFGNGNGQSYWNDFFWDSNFTLRIVLDPTLKENARTTDYEYDSAGMLVGATIYLGNDLDSGFLTGPGYPITAALTELGQVPNGLLAATKIGHEFGHLFEAYDEGVHHEIVDHLILAHGWGLMASKASPKDPPNMYTPALLAIRSVLGDWPDQIGVQRERAAEVYAVPIIVDYYLNRGIRLPTAVRRAIDGFDPSKR